MVGRGRGRWVGGWGGGGGGSGAGSQCNRLRCQKQVFIVLCAYGCAVQLCLATGTLHLYHRTDV